MSSEPIIRVRNLTKSFPIYARPSDRLKQFIFPRIRRMLGLAPKQYYRTFTALSDINFEIHKGETVGIIGRNGAGKSTLLQILCGTLSPSGGEVEVKGRVAALLELGAGFNGEYTGRENVYMNARILGLTDVEIDARFDKIVDFADIGEHFEQPVKTYSSGMYVRLAFAVIAHVDADVLIIDEALAVGDAFFTQKCMRFLQNFKLNGTLVFVSHDPVILKSLCRKSLWLSNGELISQGDTKTVSELYLADRYNITSTDLTVLPGKSVNGFNAFGSRKVVIQQVKIQKITDSSTVLYTGHEQVQIEYSMKAYQPTKNIICGFYLKNRFGEVVFGENTLCKNLNHPLTIEPGNDITCRFIFKMPALGNNVYTIDVAVAEGDAFHHQQLHWIYDALQVEFKHQRSDSHMLHVVMDQIEFSST